MPELDYISDSRLGELLEGSGRAVAARVNCDGNGKRFDYCAAVTITSSFAVDGDFGVDRRVAAACNVDDCT